ncbi:hypothetical protein CKAN_02773400 [Cinnamomum micranthum f. kanehirae]|uniref:Uncharacterized protein n=1 Tax=Cinnamomum micranthum f. kanehirae TaxID=337451 RepID=A0A3S3PV11_9MAGN|nr:hypothetical protein CKAN_02773400 [Cinnamomum micranthum f. kanehirae]
MASDSHINVPKVDTKSKPNKITHGQTIPKDEAALIHKRTLSYGEEGSSLSALLQTASILFLPFSYYLLAAAAAAASKLGLAQVNARGLVETVMSTRKRGGRCLWVLGRRLWITTCLLDMGGSAVTASSGKGGSLPILQGLNRSRKLLYYSAQLRFLTPCPLSEREARAEIGA